MAITWDARQPSEHKLLSTAVQCRHLLARCAWSFSLRPRCNNLHVCRVTLARHIRQSMRSSVHMLRALSVCLLPCFVCLSPQPSVGPDESWADNCQRVVRFNYGQISGARALSAWLTGGLTASLPAYSSSSEAIKGAVAVTKQPSM